MKQETLLFGLMALVAGLLLFNGFLQFQLGSKLGELNSPVGFVSQATPAGNSSSSSAPVVDEAKQAALIEKIIPKGIPEVYGQELGVSFDKPVEGLDVLAGLDADMLADYDNALAALALLVAESNPNEKDVMVALITQLLK